MKIKIMPGTDKGAKYVDVDSLIDILFDVWCSIRQEWEGHLEYLFNMNCSTYRVIGDVIFANDVLGSAKDRDVMLVNIKKEGSSDCSRRPMRIIQRTEAEYSDKVGETRAAHHKTRHFKQGNPNKESVCDAIVKEDFFKVLCLIRPTLAPHELEVIFNDACETSFEYVSRALNRIWTRCFDESSGRYFYVNKLSNVAQWTRPFHQKNFRSREIELDIFIKVVLKFDLLASGPFIELLHNNPKDLWPNSEMFLKQQENRHRRVATNPIATEGSPSVSTHNHLDTA